MLNWVSTADWEWARTECRLWGSEAAKAVSPLTTHLRTFATALNEGMTETPNMTLEGPNGSLQLKLDQYQFPSIKDDEWDANWLIVSGTASLNGRTWKFEDPCLTNFEAAGLADWLDDVALGKTTKDIGFVEPNLQFDLQEKASLRISFALESAPPWAEQEDEWDEHGFEVSVSSELSDAADALRQQLLQFPIRGNRPR